MNARRFVLQLGLAWLAGCTTASRGSDDDDGVADGAGVTAPAPSSPVDGAGVTIPTPSVPVGDAAGTLTAGAWDDNRNYEYFLAYLEDHAALAGRPVLSRQEREDAHDRSQHAEPRELLDVGLVVDTTGSMGDEMAYLQVEFDALSSEVQSRYPDAEQRWALVVYRDAGDRYVVESAPFTTNLEAFRATLQSQRVDGGGDYPEAADAGLETALDLAWRTGSSARLLFWVADAPHHVNAAGSMAVQIREAAARDIHVYPVAASGVDELAELTMRSAAQLSLGRYLFLTDDSGVGNPHEEPTIPCYFVTRLDHAILRMVDVEMTGQYRAPAAEEVIRSSGAPLDGVCDLGDGEQVVVF